MTDITPLTHRQIWELIPWIVNRTAAPAEREQVEGHLRDCADCRDEYALQMQLHDGMHAGAAAEHDAHPALRRLLTRIDTVELPHDEPLPRQETRGRWVQWLAAAVVVQAIGLALLGGALLTRPAVPGTAVPGTDFRTLSSAAPPSAATIRLVPSPQLPLADLQRLLAEQQLRIVESSADGRILGVAARDGADDVAARVAQLRRQPGVLLAEPAAGTAHAPR